MLTAAAVHADGAASFLEHSLASAQQCQGAINSGMEAAADCFLGSGIDSLLEQGISLSDRRLRQAYGRHFSLTGSMSWSPDVGSTGGLDLVTPFTLAGTEPGNPLAGIHSATFVQQGVTRWQDESGTMRNDHRHGLVHRFRINDKPNSDVIGLSTFYLHSAEHGHEALALGMDYFGRWGTGELRYFVPTTDWTMVRPGYEEKPLEGVELSTQFNLTTTLDLSLTGYRWEADDGSNDLDRGTRFGINWRPHSWLSFDTTYDHGNEDTTAFWMRFNLPFGPNTQKPRWEWFGVAGSGNAGNTNLFQAVPEIGHLRVASRAVEAASRGSVTNDGVSARFVESSMYNGEVAEVEVYVAEPAAADIVVTVRLEPGATQPAAVPGRDYVDRPVRAVIAQGTTRTVVSLPLLLNEAMMEPRSLGISVAVES